MKSKLQTWQRIAALATLFATAGLCANALSDTPYLTLDPAAKNAPAVQGTQDVIAQWNAEAIRLTVASGQAPVQQTRTMAIVQVSVHDAVNGITRQYNTYLSPGPAIQGSSPEAAAIAAAHHALRSVFSSSSATVQSLDALFLASLAQHGIAADDPGIEYGRDAAAAILAARAGDGASSAQYFYAAPGAGNIGIWVPLTALPALLPGWGDVSPWVLRSGSQFRPDPPPALNSEQYAKDYNEIKEIGALNSPTRTVEQTQIATFWLASPAAIWNQPLRDLVAGANFDISTRARTFALVYLAVADSSIACWEAKYEYNYWRPQPAIRRGAEDGNVATTADATWVPLFTTPRHPEYPSGHTTNSTAMATIMQLIFGDDPGVPIRSTITGIQREWGTFNEGLDEVIDARIYSGLHFRTADEVGSKQGRQVARFVWTHALKPCTNGKRSCM